MPVNKNGQLVAYLIADGFPLSQHLTRVAGILGIILISLAAGSIPLVRGITSPLEKLTQIAQRLGNGDLSVRSNIRQNDEVGRLAFALDEMADRLDKLLRGEKELLANISHELRTPLARIRVALEIAAEGDIERTRRYLSEIEKDLGEVDQLIEDIFTMTRLDLIGGKQGSLPLRFSLISVHSLIERVSQRFRTNHPLRNLQESEESIDASLSVQADEMLIRRAIGNLLENAQKYSEMDQPIVLATRLEQADHTEPQVIIEIRDQGIGIPLEEQSNLFRPFYRTEHSRARNSGGVGLGLALAKKIVEAHQGGIEVHSQPGMGTSMRIWLPIQKTL
jgi:signal transduction histidine kinase